MKLPLLLAGIALAAFSTLHTTPAQAGGHVGVDLRIGLPPPPPLRYERPYVQPGYVWTPGRWRWDGYQYVWVGGYAVPAPPPVAYYPPPPPVAYYPPPPVAYYPPPPVYYRPPYYRYRYYRPGYYRPYGRPGWGVHINYNSRR